MLSPTGTSAAPQPRERAANGQFLQIEAITVTARKIEEDLQSVPASVSVLTATDLAAAGVDAFDQVVAELPNVSMSGGIAGVLQGQLGIRGVSTLVRNIGVESGVGVYVDGVYLGRSDNYNQELIDIARIEAVRGPQGTLYGKNTIAGVFNITTLRPGAAPAGMIEIAAGDYELARVQAYWMAPVVPGVLAAKLVGGYVSREGVYEHLSGGPDSGGFDLASYRGALYYTPASGGELVLAFDGLRDRGNPAFFQVTDLAGVTSAMETTPLRLNNNRPNRLDRDNYGTSLTATFALGGGTLTSISALRRSQYDASLDDDQEQVDFLARDVWSDITKFFSQELRFARASGERLDFVAGLYYFDQEVETDRLLALGRDLGVPGEPALTTVGAVEATTYAAFGSVNYRFSPRLTASIGLRYSSEDKDARFLQGDPTGIFAFLGLPQLEYAAAAADDDLSPTATLSYQWTPEVTAYARFAKGFKSAAFNIDLVPATTGLAAGPEHATTYEAGLKSDWFERRLRANVAVFDTRYEDLQVSQLLGAGVTLNNAGRASIEGYEVELAAYATPQLKFEGSLGYLDPTYERYASCSVPISLGGGSTDCSGHRIVGAPKYTYRAAAEFAVPVTLGTFVARADFSSQSPVFFEATNSPRFASDWRSIVNARIGLRARWSVFLWGRNLTDETYITYRDDRSAVGVLQTTAYGEPRTYGITLSSEF